MYAVEFLASEQDVMDAGEGSECEGGVQEENAEEIGQLRFGDVGEQNKKDGADLGNRVEFPEDAGTKVADCGCHVKNRGDDENADIAAEDQHGVSPGDLVHKRKHKEHRTEQ